MSDGLVNYGLPVLGVVVGLAVLLYSEYTHAGDVFTYGGGAVVVLAVGVMTAAVARE